MTLASSLARHAALAALSLALSACGYECGTRASAVATGPVRDAAGVLLATAQVNISDDVGPSRLRLSAGVTGPANSEGAPLRGHVTRARLLTDTGEQLAEIPTSTATLYRDAVVALSTELPSRAEYDRVRALLLAHRVRVVLDTDVAGREHIEATLTEAHDEAPKLGRCSFVS